MTSTRAWGAAYDLFGNGKTAIKGSWGRYVVLESTTIGLVEQPRTPSASTPHSGPTIL